MKNEVHEISKIISTDFEKNGFGALITGDEFNNIQQLKLFLIPKLSFMLDNEYDKLVNFLYRIDINEKKLHDLFSSTNREFIPEQLAELIIERQIQKLHYRSRYRKGEI